MATATASRRKTVKKKAAKKKPPTSSRVKKRAGQKPLKGMDESNTKLDRLVSEHLQNLDDFSSATTAVQGSNQRLMGALEQLPEKRYFSKKYGEGFEIKATEQKLKKMKKPKVEND